MLRPVDRNERRGEIMTIQVRLSMTEEIMDREGRKMLVSTA